MRKLLYTILVIEALVTIFNFFVNLESSFTVAFINLLLNILSMVPIIAIIKNMDDIEELWHGLDNLRYNVKKLGDNIESDDSSATDKTSPAVKPAEAARGVWECVKCGTVNKEGTNRCSGCKADYSPWSNPTDSPDKKKKVSRWIK